MQIDVYLLAAGFLILCNNYDSISGSPIHGVNVRFAYPNEFPYVVSIKRSNNTNPQPETDHVCSGVLVSRKDVLTTESCMQDLNNYTPEIIAGSNNIREGIKYHILWSMTYTQWSQMRHIHLRRTILFNDLIILRLTENVNEMIVPAELSRIPDTMLGYLTGVVAAFGREIQDHISNFMETASLIILSRRTCETRLRRMREEFLVTENVVCGANKPVVLMSKGNRGAPLMQNGRLLGIYRELTPAGGDEYAPNKINLFMYLPYYKDYILDVIFNL